MHFRFIINSLARIALALAVFMATSILWALHYDETVMVSLFAEISSIIFFTALALLLLTQDKKPAISTKDRYFLVSFSWIFIGLIGALPYYVSEYIPSFIDSLFESISGFTSTGASILTNIEALPLSLLYWRALTNWIGGMGIIVLVIAVFPMFRTTGYQLFSLEASTLLNQKVKPHFADIAQRLWLIYVGLTAVLIVLLLTMGVSFYESLCHAFAATATGGFSPKNSSIAGYSANVQYIIAVFMILSAMNFTLHYYAIKGNFKPIAQNSELKGFLLIILIATAIITFVLFFESGYDFEKAFRAAFFQVASILSTTGFSTEDYLLWPTKAWVILFGLMFIGGCVGSTAGGPKVIRYVFTTKYLFKKLRLFLHPKAVIFIKVNQRSIKDSQMISVLTFISFYFLIFAAGVFVMSLLGLDLSTSSGSVVTCMGGIGPGIGLVGPASSFSMLPDLAKIFLSFIMIIGRLEVITFMVLFTPHFWKSKIG